MTSNRPFGSFFYDYLSDPPFVSPSLLAGAFCQAPSDNPINYNLYLRRHSYALYLDKGFHSGEWNQRSDHLYLFKPAPLKPSLTKS